MNNDELDIAPDDPTELAPLGQFLPENFPLLTLLRFLPDVKLKSRVQVCADFALAVDVKADGGLQRADKALADLKTALKAVADGFDEPVTLANQLHKRLTGLRGDFTRYGEQAVLVVGQAIYAETTRLRKIADEERRLAQAQADREARERADQLAKEAKAHGASKETVAALKEQAKVATAPPVPSPSPAPTLKESVPVEKWKARLMWTMPGHEPNPNMNDLTEPQQVAARSFFRGVADGEIPLAYAAINWSVVNQNANAQRTTFAVHGLEAFDDGSMRGKGRR